MRKMPPAVIGIGLCLTAVSAYANGATAINNSDIFSFLSSPGTTVFRDSDIEWSSSYEFLRKGNKLPDGGCQFISGADASDTKQEYSVLEEVAVDREKCISLVRAGIPTPNGWANLKKALNALGNKQIGNKSAIVNPRSDAEVASANVVSDAGAPSQSTTPGTEAYTYSLSFTDGNQPLMAAVLPVLNTALAILNYIGLGLNLGLNGIPAGSVSTTVSYSYDSSYPLSSGGCAYVPQSSLTLNKPSPGPAAWSTTAGGACSSWTQAVNGAGVITVYNGIDQNGNSISAAAAKAICDSYVPTFRDCGSISTQTTSTTMAIGGVSFGTFYNNSSLPYTYDCTMGIYLVVPYAYVYSAPINTFHGSGTYNIVGGEDANNAVKCRSNIKVIETGSTTN